MWLALILLVFQCNEVVSCFKFYGSLTLILYLEMYKHEDGFVSMSSSTAQ